MKKASDYLQHAAECRALAARMELGDARDQLLRMAATWETLARERSAMIQRHPDLAADGEAQELAARCEGKRS